MSYITRTLSNLWKIGFKEYGHQLHYMGDTKYGVLVGIDRYGNRYFENKNEIPGRTRWVDFKMHEYDSSHIEPGWRAWMNCMVDKPPTEDPVLQSNTKPWETPDHKPNYTLTRGAYRPYNTVKPKISAWQPVAAPR
ncbi:hypothetical protein KEM54_000624 [Ascosphaera aggregata]|nr:hypothetical protein KEM54_000624 [Ascosphaera aggregata]